MLCKTLPRTTLLIKLREFSVITELRECHARSVLKYSRRLEAASWKRTVCGPSEPAARAGECHYVETELPPGSLS